MLYATGIKMCAGKESCCDTQHIYQIFIQDNDGALKEGSRYYSREGIHDYLVERPNSIRVNIGPDYPYCEPRVSSNGVKYVRSQPNDSPHDNLLKLPGGPYNP